MLVCIPAPCNTCTILWKVQHMHLPQYQQLPLWNPPHPICETCGYEGTLTLEDPENLLSPTESRHICLQIKMYFQFFSSSSTFTHTYTEYTPCPTNAHLVTVLQFPSAMSSLKWYNYYIAKLQKFEPSFRSKAEHFHTRLKLSFLLPFLLLSCLLKMIE